MDSQSNYAKVWFTYILLALFPKGNLLLIIYHNVQFLNREEGIRSMRDWEYCNTWFLTAQRWVLTICHSLFICTCQCPLCWWFTFSGWHKHNVGGSSPVCQVSASADQGMYSLMKQQMNKCFNCQCASACTYFFLSFWCIALELRWNVDVRSARLWWRQRQAPSSGFSGSWITISNKLTHRMVHNLLEGPAAQLFWFMCHSILICLVDFNLNVHFIEYCSSLFRITFFSFLFLIAWTVSIISSILNRVCCILTLILNWLLTLYLYNGTDSRVAIYITYSLVKKIALPYHYHTIGQLMHPPKG